MNRPSISSAGYLRFGLILVFAVHVFAQQTAIPPLSPNDVSWLFPPPTKIADLDKLIAVRDLTAPNPGNSTKRDPIWADAIFGQFVAIAASSAAEIANTQNRLGLPRDAQSIDAWFVSGVRIDAGAPGLSPDIRAQFGQSPEIRLIIQPVTRSADGSVTVNDFAGHLIFDFLAGLDDPAQPGCLQRPKPDLVEFNKIVAELAELRTKLASGQLCTNRVATSGALGIHPGLVDPTTAANVRAEMKAFLERHLSAARLNAMALVGVPAEAASPWIFLSMRNFHPGEQPTLPTGGVVPVSSPTLDGTQVSEMLAPGAVPGVVPEPHANNLNKPTCKNAAVPTANIPINNRNGSSTSALFANPPPSVAAVQQVLAVITDPTKSHFFNTDCVSCHTETRRAMVLLNLVNFPGIAPAVLPPGDYTVRNFGWSPAIDGPIQGVVTRRTAAETDAVVGFINSQILNK